MEAPCMIQLKGEGWRTGTLSTDWSGDFVLTNQLGVETATFSADRISTIMPAGNSPEPGLPWRLILSLFLATAAAVATAFGALHATLQWRPASIRQRR